MKKYHYKYSTNKKTAISTTPLSGTAAPFVPAPFLLSWPEQRPGLMPLQMMNGLNSQFPTLPTMTAGGGLTTGTTTGTGGVGSLGSLTCETAGILGSVDKPASVQGKWFFHLVNWFRIFRRKRWFRRLYGIGFLWSGKMRCFFCTIEGRRGRFYRMGGCDDVT